MADVVGLDGKQVVRAPGERATDVQEVLEDAAKLNAKEEVRSILIMTVGYDGEIQVMSVRDWADDWSMIGRLEMLKHGLMQRHWNIRLQDVVEKQV